MNKNNLIFSSNIDAQIEDLCFDMFYNYVSEWDCEEMFVHNVIIAPKEILFFTKIDGNESIIRVPISND